MAVGRRVVAELLQHLGGALPQALRRFFHRHAPVQRNPLREDEAERDERERRGEQSGGYGRPEAPVLARGGDHFGRWRLARGERGGERVSAGQRRRDL
jgi:hypothetical protein